MVKISNLIYTTNKRFYYPIPPLVLGPEISSTVFSVFQNFPRIYKYIYSIKLVNLIKSYLAHYSSIFILNIIIYKFTFYKKK